MAARRVVLALVAALALTGCGGSDDDAAPEAAAAETAIATASRTPIPAGKPLTPGKGEKKAGAAATAGGVAPEVVVPSTTDAVSAQTGDSWQGLTVQELRKIEPRLVTSDAAAIKKVRATCLQMETGMFETKIVPIIVKRFSTPTFTPTYELGQEVYSILLQYACYHMNET